MAVKKFVNDENLIFLEKFANALKAQSNAKEFEDFTNEFLEKNGIKLKDIAQALSIALTGNAVSPSIFEVLEFLGIQECKQRIQKFLEFRKKQ